MVENSRPESSNDVLALSFFPETVTYRAPIMVMEGCGSERYVIKAKPVERPSGPPSIKTMSPDTDEVESPARAFRQYTGRANVVPFLGVPDRSGTTEILHQSWCDAVPWIPDTRTQEIAVAFVLSVIVNEGPPCSSKCQSCPQSETADKRAGDHKKKSSFRTCTDDPI